MNSKALPSKISYSDPLVKYTIIASLLVAIESKDEQHLPLIKQKRAFHVHRIWSHYRASLDCLWCTLKVHGHGIFSLASVRQAKCVIEKDMCCESAAR